MNNLRTKRVELGLTQPQVSKALKAVEPRADVGMISRYEKGVCLPTSAQLDKLEDILQAGRLELWDADAIDLLRGAAALGDDVTLCGDAEHDSGACKTAKQQKETRFRKCYRIPREFAASLPEDLLAVCGYNSWQSWHDAALKRLLAEYAARKKVLSSKERRRDLEKRA
jgi:transcriptional regulator with XRE-family HTH domain